MPTKEYFQNYYLVNRERIIKRVQEYNTMHILARKEYDHNRYISKKKPIRWVKIDSAVNITFN
jgi:hypothetical protein